MRYAKLWIFLFHSVLCSASAQSAPSHGGWKLESEKEGIKVYTRAVYGTDLKQIKAVTFIEAPMQAIMQVLTDYENYHLWVNNVRESSIMNQQDEANVLVYSLEDAPWPVQNRFHVDRITENLGETISTLVFKSIPDYLDEQIPEAIEAAHHEGFWRVKSTHEGGCEIEFVVDQNPGGYIPSWLVNYMAIDSPIKTLRNLKTRVVEILRS